MRAHALDRPDGTVATRRDLGQSLVEVVVTISIIAIVLVPIMTAVITNIRTSSSLRNSSLVETVVENAADRVNRAPKVCDYTVYVQAAAQSQGWTASQATVSQQHYVPGADPTVAGRWDSGACIGTATKPADLLVQLVTITVQSPDGRNSKTIQVVKSDV
ncbi:MAG: prepilin-type N-terminal cleavage/methylation domain-containing protein [Ilumatobacteraceae bacterium]